MIENRNLETFHQRNALSVAASMMNRMMHISTQELKLSPH